MRSLLLSVVLLSALKHAVVCQDNETKGAKISLHAAWPSTPLLHEAAEFLVRWPAAACSGANANPVCAALTAPTSRAGGAV